MHITYVHTMIFSLLMSIIGTLVGAFIGVSTGKASKSKFFLGGITAVASGIMFSISILELLPEALEKQSVDKVILAAFVGIFVILMLEGFSKAFKVNEHKKVAFMVAISLMLHNFPEGLVMGLGLASGLNLAIKMSIIIMLHDIPEGIAVAAPLKISNESNFKIYLYSFITGLPAVFGAILGFRLGEVSQGFLGLALAFAAGIMLYVSTFQMYKESKEICGGANSLFYTIVGICIGVFMVFAL